MRLVVFASGSSGNCALVRGEHTALLIDAGISMRRIREALRGEGLTPEDISGVLITHEHSDHITALRTMSRSCGIPVYAPGSVIRYLDGQIPELGERLNRIRENEEFRVGGLTVRAFPTPHDTDQSVGYRVSEGESLLGFCTDTGCVTETMLDNLSGCRTALIEANHDPERLLSGPYPFYLKKRILSERGHLSNGDSAGLACTLASRGTRTLVLGHLSRENNTPELARSAVRTALDRNGYADVELYIAPVSGALSVEI